MIYQEKLKYWARPTRDENTDCLKLYTATKEGGRKKAAGKKWKRAIYAGMGMHAEHTVLSRFTDQLLQTLILNLEFVNIYIKVK